MEMQESEKQYRSADPEESSPNSESAGLNPGRTAVDLIPAAPKEKPAVRVGTGPRSQHGKRTSSRNALKHGFLSKEVVVRTMSFCENHRDFKKLLTWYIRHYKPEGPAEMLQLELAVVALWRMRRLLKAEGGAILLHQGLFRESSQAKHPLEIMNDGSRSDGDHKEAENTASDRRDLLERRAAIPLLGEIDRLMRYETHFLRILYRALHELERLQRMRRGDAVPTPIVVDFQH